MQKPNLVFELFKKNVKRNKEKTKVFNKTGYPVSDPV